MKHPYPTLSYIVGLFSGLAIGIIIGLASPRGIVRHTHQFGMWTNSERVRTLDARYVWQERYCTNCGKAELERH